MMLNNDEDVQSSRNHENSRRVKKLIESSFIVNSLNQKSSSLNRSKSLISDYQNSFESSKSQAPIEEEKRNDLPQKSIYKLNLNNPKIVLHSSKASLDFTLTESELENHPVLIAESKQKEIFSPRLIYDLNGKKGRTGPNEIKKLEKDCCELCEIPIQDSLEFPKLQYLSYNKNRIRKIPNYISSFLSLQELILDNNFIAEIPDIISNLNNLTLLSVSYNLITNISPLIGNLMTLKILIINNNLIYEIPKSLFNLNLEIFHFHNNKITELPNQFYKFTQINEISFDWFYYISPFSIKLNNKKVGKSVISDFFRLCKSLEKINQSCTFPKFILFFYKISFEEILNEPIFGRGKTLLHKAAFHGDLTIIKLLLTYNCDINKLDNNQCTALLISLKANKLEATFELLKNPNCDVNIVSRRFGSPLLIALLQQKYNVAKLILSRENCKADLIDKEGNNCFHLIFGKYKISEPIIEKICDILIEKNCPVNIKNNSHLTPLQIALKKNQKAALEYAIRKNKVGKIFDFNLIGGKYNWNALHFAVVYSDLGILRDLLQSDLNLFTLDKQGKSAIDLAIIKSIPQKLIKKAQKIKLKEMLHIPECEKKVSKNIYLNLPRLNISKQKKIIINQLNELSEGDNEVERKIKEYSQENLKIINASKLNFRRQISLDIPKDTTYFHKPKSIMSINPASKNYIFSGAKNYLDNIPEINYYSTKAQHTHHFPNNSYDLNSKIHSIKVFTIHKNYELGGISNYKSNREFHNSPLAIEGKKCIEEKIFEKFKLSHILKTYKNNSISIFMKSRILYSIFLKKPLDFKQILQILKNYSLNNSLINSIKYLSMLMETSYQTQIPQNKKNTEEVLGKKINISQKNLINNSNQIRNKETTEGKLVKVNTKYFKFNQNTYFYSQDKANKNNVFI